MTENTTGCLWCAYRGPLLAGETVAVANPQVSLPHDLRRCPECHEAMLDVRWPDRVVRRKAREHSRRFRKSLWVVVYPVLCAWCGSDNTEAYEINATIANPISERFKYDIYRCRACQRPNAASYLGEIHVHRADQDREYTSLWYLDPPELATESL
jgi:hypothetical protein